MAHLQYLALQKTMLARKRVTKRRLRAGLGPPAIHAAPLRRSDILRMHELITEGPTKRTTCLRARLEPFIGN